MDPRNNKSKQSSPVTVHCAASAQAPLSIASINTGIHMPVADDCSPAEEQAPPAVSATAQRTLGRLAVDLANAKKAMETLKATKEEDAPLQLDLILEAAAKALVVYRTFSNTPPDINNSEWSTVDYPVYSAVEEFEKAVEDLKRAIKQKEEAQDQLMQAESKAQEEEDKYSLAASKDPKDLQLLEDLKTIASFAAEKVCDKAEKVCDKAEKVWDKAEKVYKGAALVSTQLNSFAKLNNGSEVTSQSQTPSQGINKLVENPKHAPIIDSEDPTTTMLRSPKPLTFPHRPAPPASVESFYNFLEALMKDAPVVVKDKEEPFLKELIEATVKRIRNFPEDNQSPAVSDDNPYGRARVPVPPGLEKEGVQPLLGAILSMMMQLVGRSTMKAGSPARNHLERERSIIAQNTNGSEKERYIDFTLLKDVKWTPQLQGAYRELPIEAKCLGTKKKVLATLLLEAMDQVIGHLSKRLRSAFDFGGVGVDCKATGAVMTLAHIEIVQLSLCGMGSADARLELSSTEKRPLFSKEVVTKLLGATDNDMKAPPFLEELFPEGKEATSVCSEGMDALFQILLCETDELFTPYWRNNARYESTMPNNKTYELQKRLGAGAFGTVYSVEDVPNMVVKASHKSEQYQNSGTDTIENEIKVLKALQTASSKCVNIPQFLNNGTLAIKVRGSQVNFPALGTSPMGVSIDHHLHTLPVPFGSIKEAILLVAKDVRAALDFAHIRSWFHLDVRPSNIVLEMDEQSKPFRAILIDWGIASENRASVTGFRGSKLYAHREIFLKQKEKWIPEAKHDLASLFYTLVVMAGGGHVPWSPYPADIKIFLEFRQTLAETIYETSGSDLSDIMRELKNACGPTQVDSTKAQASMEID